jgi:hypothetical protein
MARINSKQIRCRTFDQLADDLERRLTVYLKTAVKVSEAVDTGEAERPV